MHKSNHLLKVITFYLFCKKNQMELKTIPLLDNFETTLSQEWDWQIWKMKVDDLPNIPLDASGKFAWGFTTYVVVNPDKQNSQIAEIDGYNSQEKTLNVINVNLEKWLNLNYNPSFASQKSIVRISNNFAFWKKIAEVVNSKQDYGIWAITGDYFLNVSGSLKFKDGQNSEITLSDIAWKIGQNNKVSIDWTDSSNFLKNKIWKWLKISGSLENKKVEVDFQTADFWNLKEENFNENIFLLTTNNKKISLSGLLASENDILSKNPRKFVTADQLWGDFIVFTGDEEITSINSNFGGNFEEKNFSDVFWTSVKLAHRFRKKCLLPWTYKIIIKTSVIVNLTHKMVVKHNNKVVHHQSVKFWNNDNPVTIYNILPWDYIEIFADDIIREVKITGNIQRKNILPILE